MFLGASLVLKHVFKDKHLHKRCAESGPNLRFVYFVEAGIQSAVTQAQGKPGFGDAS